VRCLECIRQVWYYGYICEILPPNFNPLLIATDFELQRTECELILGDSNYDATSVGGEGRKGTNLLRI